MSLFDHVTFDPALPDGRTGAHLQSKDTPSQRLQRYAVTVDGALIHLIGPAVPVLPKSATGIPNTGAQHRDSEIIAPVDFTGSIDLYDERSRFTAAFENGRLTDVVAKA